MPHLCIIKNEYSTESKKIAFPLQYWISKSHSPGYNILKITLPSAFATQLCLQIKNYGPKIYSKLLRLTTSY